MSPGSLTPLAHATDAGVYGGKAAQLAAALAAGLPVPGGFALSWESVRAAVASDPYIHAEIRSGKLTAGPWAVRSSAIGEDSQGASFAGTHLSVLGLVRAEAVLTAIRRVHDSANDPAALTYRRQRGLDPTPRMAVALQEMVDAEVAGVLFTRNPVTGASERLIEASWGLGETVVSGRVTPDQYRLDSRGRILERCPGEKDIALRLQPDGSVSETEVEPDLVQTCCLLEEHLLALHRLARACDRVFESHEHDIEFAFARNRLFLLQRRPITHA